MKVVITENQFKRVILKEQSNPVLEKVKGSFSTNNADSAHNFQEMENKIGISLNKFYKQGINPKISKVSATISGKGSHFTSTYSAEIIDNGSGDAWTGFFSRGSIGSNDQSRAKSQRYEKDPTNKKLPNSTVEERMVIYADADKFEDIQPSPIRGTNPNFTQYFVQFTKKKKPKHSSSQSPTTQPQSINKKKIRHNGSVKALKAGLKQLWQDGHTGVVYNKFTHDSPPYSYVSITIDPSQQKKIQYELYLVK